MSELSDRDLCLGLAERLGWGVDGGLVTLSDSGEVRWKWLLTPSGCFALLDAMRELGWELNCRDELLGWSVTYCRFAVEDDQRLVDVRHEQLGRAICEAAYSALGASDER